VRYDFDVVSPRIAAALPLGVVLLVGALETRPGSVDQTPASGPIVYTVLSREGRRPLEARRADGQDLVALDDLGPLFGLTLREDAATGTLTLARQGQTIVLSRGQALASVAGRLIALPAPPVREDRRWYAPVELLARAVAPVAGVRIEVRKASRLVVVGDLRVPRVDLRYEGAGPRARLVVDIDPAAAYRVAREDGRLTVAIDADALDAHLAPPEEPALVSAIRVAEPSTLVVELGPAFASFRTSELPAARGTARVAIELVGTAGEARPPAPEPPVPPPVGPPPSVEFPAPGGLRTIVVDPGHGGDEPGARGPGGTLEKDVTLAVARRLEAALQARLGTRVLLTRTGDETVSLDERAARANTNKADLFVSLHANASMSRATTGAEVLWLGVDDYAPGAGAAGSATIEGPLLSVFGGAPRRLDLVDWETAQVHHLADSAALAAAIQEALGRLGPVRSDAVGQAPLRVLVGVNMPAVLVELGFLTNADEERRLASESHQAALVQALVDGIVRFRDRARGTAAAPAAGPGPAIPRF
jgi:N-acetylmuramoyl-L-alanine amidase